MCLLQSKINRFRLRRWSSGDNLPLKLARIHVIHTQVSFSWGLTPRAGTNLLVTILLDNYLWTPPVAYHSTCHIHASIRIVWPLSPVPIRIRILGAGTCITQTCHIYRTQLLASERCSNQNMNFTVGVDTCRHNQTLHKYIAQNYWPLSPVPIRMLNAGANTCNNQTWHIYHT